MSHIDLVINISGALLIIAIIWWFWLASPKTLKAGQTIHILVDGGSYSPARIQVTKGQEITLIFHRKDANPCAEKVIFGQLNISEELPLDGEKKIQLKLEQVGEYEFTCQMSMYRGVLVVV